MIKEFIDMIEKAEWDWENKPHVICPKCGTEYIKDDPHPETFCNEIQRLKKERS